MTPALLNVSMRFIDEFLTEPSILELATHLGFRVYDPSIVLPVDTFNAANGVIYDISGIPKMDVPKDPNVRARVADFWLMNRPVI